MGYKVMLQNNNINVVTKIRFRYRVPKPGTEEKYLKFSVPVREKNAQVSDLFDEF